MDNSILALLKAERTRIDKAIALFEPTTSTPAPETRGQQNQPRRHGRKMSAAARKAMSAKLKAIWASKKKASAARSKAAKARVAKKAS